MRPNDPGLENAAIYSTNEVLQKLLGKDFASAAALPPEEPKRVTLTAEPVEPNAPTTSEPKMSYDELQLLIKSNYKSESLDAYNVAHEDDPDGDEKTEERKRKKSVRMATYASRMDVFSHNGFELSYRETMDSFKAALDNNEAALEKTEQELAKAKEELVVEDEDYARSSKSGVIYRTEAEYEHAIMVQGSDAVEGGSVTLDQTAVVDGERVDLEVKAQMEALEAERQALEAEQKLLEEHQRQIAINEGKVQAGEMTPEDAQAYIDGMPDSVKDVLIEAHVENEQTLSTEAPVADAEKPTVTTDTPAAPQYTPKNLNEFAL